MASLESLLDGVATLSVAGGAGVEVSGICYDSREAGPGSMFVALRGEQVDGHDYVERAIEAGCVAVVAEALPGAGAEGVAWVHVAKTREALAEISANFFGRPSGEMAVAGVTGTNGKTTTVFLLHHLLQSAWHRCGMLGTVCYFDGVESSEAARTTPESRDLQGILGAMRDNGCRGAVMEVSSHALVQERVKAVAFDVGVFTNLSQDHLDYHKGIEQYFEAKALLFEQLATAGARGKAVVNIDDAYGRRLVKRFGERLDLVTYGMGLKADFRALDVRCDFDGTRFKLEAKGREFLVRLPLIGKFNVYNALAAIVAGNALGLNLRESLGYLGAAPQVPGRLESVAAKKPFRVFVDYAHTPDALENVLETLRDLEPNRLITVFGCGGDRDQGKRPLMGAVAERLSDVCVVTSDNPRGEDPNKIIKGIETGMKSGRHAVVVDRAEAIKTAIGGAKGGDIVLVAGKGHETYQEVGGERTDFDDRRVAEWALKEWVNPHMKRADGEGAA